MGLFSKLFKLNSTAAAPVEENIKADITLFAPVTGTLLPLEEVPDIVISEKVIGDGVAIIPESESILAPCSGVITRLLPTKNAFAIKTPENIEIYVTFGVESMEMQGEGFTTKLNIGDEVKCGDPILQIDLRILSSKLKSIVTSMIVIKSNLVEKVVAATGKAQAGSTPILWLTLNR